MKKNCAKCNLEFEFMDKNSRFSNLLNCWLCKDCNKSFQFKLEALKINFLKENPHYKKQFDIFPPPWNIYENPEKTEGWIEFQKEMKKHPEYYLMEYKK